MLENSKPLTINEKKIAIAKNTNYPYRIAVVSTYNLLKEEGHDLNKQGVNFFDLTMIFLKENRDIYVDTCCHINETGYDILTTQMAKDINGFFTKF